MSPHQSEPFCHPRTVTASTITALAIEQRDVTPAAHFQARNRQTGLRFAVEAQDTGLSINCHFFNAKSLTTSQIIMADTCIEVSINPCDSKNLTFTQAGKLRAANGTDIY